VKDSALLSGVVVSTPDSRSQVRLVAAALPGSNSGQVVHTHVRSVYIT